MTRGTLPLHAYHKFTRSPTQIYDVAVGVCTWHRIGIEFILPVLTDRHSAHASRNHRPSHNSLHPRQRDKKS